MLAAVMGLMLASPRPTLAGELAGSGQTLLPNGSFETDANHDSWPDGWGRIPEAQWEAEGDNHFLRLTSPEPGKAVMLYQPVPLPAGIKAIRLSWRQRVSNLKVGKEAWFDARIIMNFKDAMGGKLIPPSPPASYSHENTPGWQSRTMSFLVPEGAKVLELMPALFQVESGTYDLDDVVLAATDPTPLQAASKKAEAEAKAAQVAPEAP